jgi:hypothetical protein
MDRGGSPRSGAGRGDDVVTESRRVSKAAAARTAEPGGVTS